MLSVREQDKVNIQAVYDLLILKKEVYPQDLDYQSMKFYESVKSARKDNTIVKYCDHNGIVVEKRAIELPDEWKAMMLFTPISFYRWNDNDNLYRLKSHFGMKHDIKEILYLMGVLRENGMNDILSTQDRIDRFLEVSRATIMAAKSK